MSLRSSESVELPRELDLSDMPPSMAVVSDEPRKPRAFLVGRKRWKGQAHPETTTVDPWSHGGDEEIRLFQNRRHER